MKLDIYNKLILVKRLINYNLKIIFANKFLYFLLASLAIFILVTVINLFDTEWYPDQAAVYYLLLIPGLLLIFFPAPLVFRMIWIRG